MKYIEIDLDTNIFTTSYLVIGEEYIATFRLRVERLRRFMKTPKQEDEAAQEPLDNSCFLRDQAIPDFSCSCMFIVTIRNFCTLKFEK